MQILEPSLVTPQLWDQALLQRPSAHFLQSWAWYQFQLDLHNQAWPLVVVHEGEVINQLLVIRLHLAGNFHILYSPRGSLINPTLSLADQAASQKLLLQKIQELGRAHHCILFRIDPEVDHTNKTTFTVYRDCGFVHQPSRQIQPTHSLILDLNMPLAHISSLIKSKTRYNIRVASKSGVEVVAGTPQDLHDFLALTKLTASRDDFKPHSDQYYQKQFARLGSANIQELYIAKLNQKPIAGILVNFFGNRATYVHGASDYDHRPHMAPYLLQWFAISQAHARGFREYDFGGIHPSPTHRWAGITRFKQGFGGKATQYIGTFELPISKPLYFLYQLISRLK